MKPVRKTPEYYIGKNNYHASEVVYGFSATYNVGTALTYLMRAGKKKEEGMSDVAKHIEDIEKAIHHLQMEIKQLQIDNLITEGMSYEKAIATLERINEIQNKFNKK
jgi:prefoldin subunit 5